jgi:hypothetical protein
VKGTKNLYTRDLLLKKLSEFQDGKDEKFIKFAKKVLGQFGTNNLTNQSVAIEQYIRKMYQKH